MVMDILDYTLYSPCGNHKHISNSTLLVLSGVGEDVVLCDVWEVVLVPHVW